MYVYLSSIGYIVQRENQLQLIVIGFWLFFKNFAIWITPQNEATATNGLVAVSWVRLGWFFFGSVNWTCKH